MLLPLSRFFLFAPSLNLVVTCLVFRARRVSCWWWRYTGVQFVVLSLFVVVVGRWCAGFASFSSSLTKHSTRTRVLVK